MANLRKRKDAKLDALSWGVSMVDRLQQFLLQLFYYIEVYTFYLMIVSAYLLKANYAWADVQFEGDQL